MGHYATKTLGSKAETTGKDLLRDAWGCWLLPVCSGISCASWQNCQASPLLCQGTAQNQGDPQPSLAFAAQQKQGRPHGYLLLRKRQVLLQCGWGLAPLGTLTASAHSQKSRDLLGGCSKGRMP